VEFLTHSSSCDAMLEYGARGVEDEVPATAQSGIVVTPKNDNHRQIAALHKLDAGSLQC
jgi:hypothetical protein